MTPAFDIRLSGRAVDLEERPLARRVGLIILATDHTTEPDFCRMVAGNRIGVYVARVGHANPVTPENLRAMQPALTDAVALILPGELLDAVCYSCTAASVVIGDTAVEAAIREAKPDVPVVLPTRAACHGLAALGARRISILTPYTVATSEPMADYFTAQGFDLASFTCLGLDDDRMMARIAPGALVETACQATAADAEALFISCTALRAAGVVARIEHAIGRPVVTSNLATAWACLRLCGDNGPHADLGRLMTLPLPAVV